jgi:arylsulfatase A
MRFICLPLVTAWLFSTATEADVKPNFIVILTDDQGYADLGCYGARTIKTPNIDRMARGGVRLTSFYAAAPICTPTRAALMTGCYATRVGLPTPLHVYDTIGLNAAEETLPEALQRQGYRTACIGKWHLGHAPKFYPTRHGFGVYWGTPLGHMFNRPAVGKAIGDTSALFLDNEKEIPYPDDEHLTERLTNVAVDFINTNKTRPFFLFLSHTMPHEPLAVSERFAGVSEGGLYGDVIECLDWSTGRVLDALDRNDLLQKTVVIYTSDNGPKKGHGTARPLRGYKHQPYEGGVRVPCVVYAPGRISAGTTVDAIATIMDVYPTLVGLAGGTISSEQVCDGKDIWSLLTGSPNAKSPHAEFYYFVRHGVLVGIRQGRWKLLRQEGRTELYDLEGDVGESINLAKQRPEIVRKLVARLGQFEADIRESRRPPGVP